MRENLLQITMLRRTHPQSVNAELPSEYDVAKLFANPTTRHIVASCIRKAKTVKELSEVTDTPLASTYRQVADLVAHRVLRIERSALSKDGKPYDLYRSNVKDARMTVQAGSVDLDWNLLSSPGQKLAHMWGQLVDA